MPVNEYNIKILRKLVACDDGKGLPLDDVQKSFAKPLVQRGWVVTYGAGNFKTYIAQHSGREFLYLFDSIKALKDMGYNKAQIIAAFNATTEE